MFFHLKRAVALGMIVCLLADPATVSAFSTSKFSFQLIRASSSLFNQQAFAMRALEERQELLSPRQQVEDLRLQTRAAGGNGDLWQHSFNGPGPHDPFKIMERLLAPHSDRPTGGSYRERPRTLKQIEEELLNHPASEFSKAESTDVEDTHLGSLADIKLLIEQGASLASILRTLAESRDPVKNKIQNHYEGVLKMRVRVEAVKYASRYVRITGISPNQGEAFQKNKAVYINIDEPDETQPPSTNHLTTDTFVKDIQYHHVPGATSYFMEREGDSLHIRAEQIPNPGAAPPEDKVAAIKRQLAKKNLSNEGAIKGVTILNDGLEISGAGNPVAKPSVENFINLMLQAQTASRVYPGPRVQLQNGQAVTLNTSYINQHGREFISGVQALRGAYENRYGRNLRTSPTILHTQLVNLPSFSLTLDDVLILIEIGKVLGLWKAESSEIKLAGRYADYVMVEISKINFDLLENPDSYSSRVRKWQIPDGPASGGTTAVVALFASSIAGLLYQMWVGHPGTQAAFISNPLAGIALLILMGGEISHRISDYWRYPKDRRPPVKLPGKKYAAQEAAA